MAEIGRFQQLLILQKQRITFQGPSGAKVVSFDTIATDVWGSIEAMDGDEPMQGGALTSYVPQKITTRYDPAIDSTCRFVLVEDSKTRYFNVISTYSPREDQEKSVSKCREDTSVNAPL